MEHADIERAALAEVEKIGAILPDEYIIDYSAMSLEQIAQWVERVEFRVAEIERQIQGLRDG